MGYPLSIRCTPTHRVVEGNEIADTYAKWATDGYSDTDKLDKDYLQEASLAHLIRKAAEAKTRSMKDWIRWHVKAERRYRPPRGGEFERTSGRKESLADSSSPSPAMQRSAHIYKDNTVR